MSAENCKQKFARISGSPEEDLPEEAEIKDDFLVRHFCLVGYWCGLEPLMGLALQVTSLWIHFAPAICSEMCCLARKALVIDRSCFHLNTFLGRILSAVSRLLQQTVSSSEPFEGSQL